MIGHYIQSALCKQIDLGLELPEHVDHQISGNRDLLQEALRNLLENALEYSPNDSIVTVRVLPQRDWLCIDVIDNGPGIQLVPPQGVFDRFQRGDHPKGYGCGFSLAIVQESINLHQGHINLLKSTSSGTVLRLYLPYLSHKTRT